MICILDVLGGRTSATRDTRLMCVIEEPVIPDTNASLSILYPSVIFGLVSRRVNVDRGPSTTRDIWTCLPFPVLRHLHHAYFRVNVVSLLSQIIGSKGPNRTVLPLVPTPCSRVPRFLHLYSHRCTPLLQAGKARHFGGDDGRIF